MQCTLWHALSHRKMYAIYNVCTTAHSNSTRHTNAGNHLTRSYIYMTLTTISIIIFFWYVFGFCMYACLCKFAKLTHIILYQKRIELEQQQQQQQQWQQRVWFKNLANGHNVHIFEFNSIWKWFRIECAQLICLICGCTICIK